MVVYYTVGFPLYLHKNEKNVECNVEKSSNENLGTGENEYSETDKERREGKMKKKPNENLIQYFDPENCFRVVFQ